MEKIALNHSSSAINSLSSGFEGLTKLRVLFLASSQSKPTSKTLAIGLLDKALSCITSALSELQAISPSSMNAAAAPAIEDRNFVTDPKKRKKTQSWTISTSVPHFDGHQWRKYGQKRILNSMYPRSYYKCTHHKDQGCPATKTIQQKEEKFFKPPKYTVSYNMQHTCKPKETQEIPFVMDSSAITNTSCSTNIVSSTYSSNEILPLQVEEMEQDCLMESMLLSSEPREEVNATHEDLLRSSLAALDFDWGWHDELIAFEAFGNVML
ncbi:probable WRKY transcription factor 70 [Phalaenopsis equestris]|uniref:probable WRKY transcription factor 70 n=1 Tax=Phalaenopsis equestris TaxID=78828 RepID=UPI0009E431AB|nr:probable WRKY transcription factor 70 [Phalaenopsis equestris]